MTWQYTPIALVNFTAAALIAALALLVWLRGAGAGKAAFLVMSLGVIEWATGNAFEMLAGSLQAKILFATIQYLGIVTVPVAWFTFTLAYTGRREWLTVRNLLLLAIIPGLSLVMVATNGYHHLFWESMAVADTPFHTLAVEHGPLFWIQASYGYIMLLAGTGVIVYTYTFSPRVYRHQMVLLLVGTFTPWVGNLIYLAGVSPYNKDLTPFAFTVTSLAVGWSFLRFRLLDLVPVAREAVIESLEDGVIVIDEQQRVVDLNKAAANILGKTVPEPVGSSIDEVFTGHLSYLRSLAAGGAAHTEVAIAVGGDTRYFDLQVSMLYDREHEIGTLFTMRDITSRVVAEQILKAAHDQLTVLREVDVALAHRINVNYVFDIIVDAAMRLSRADTCFIATLEDHNLRIVRALGRGRGKLIDQIIPADLIVSGWSKQPDRSISIHGLVAVLEQLGLEGEKEAVIGVPLAVTDRLVGIIAAAASDPARFSDDVFDVINRLAAHAAVAIESARMYEERERLIQELDAFAHTVAHDLKNPVSLIIGYARLFADSQNGLSAEERQLCAENILQSSQKADQIIQALLQLSGVRTTEKVKLGRLDMQIIVQETIKRLALLIEEYNATIEGPDTWPSAKGYTPWVEEIWLNYLSNALKYGGSPPHVTVGYDALPDEQFRFWVRDNGIGLTLEDQSRLFQPFTRLSQADIQGHGLGLSIVQRITEKLGGSVGVESEVGKGSTFWFTLSACTDLPHPQTDASETPPTASDSTPR